ncbi:YlxM family DNA-binding protein [Pelosinus sp. sgz500959]|uniref:YlxM family DNA-binding protein n=1 Tax=Pelosinus sp. sgz500959 TaxID=3242472 RepID=UPI00366C49F4
MLEKVLRIVILFDFYGSLLTEKQQFALEMHCLKDFSLAEIADELGVSRQAVHDLLKRAEQILMDYEEKLKFVERYQREQQTLQHIYNLIEKLPDSIRYIPELDSAVKELNCLLDYSKEV